MKKTRIDLNVRGRVFPVGTAVADLPAGINLDPAWLLADDAPDELSDKLDIDDGFDDANELDQLDDETDETDETDDREDPDAPPMFGLPVEVIDLLAAHDPPITTEDELLDYGIANRDNYSKITGIGRVTSNKINAAIAGGE